MHNSTLKLTRQTTVWRAWIGFNISHGMGVVLFGVVYLALAIVDFRLLSEHWLLSFMAPGIAATYLLLSINYWFHIPAAGTGFGLACFIAALALR